QSAQLAQLGGRVLQQDGVKLVGHKNDAAVLLAAQKGEHARQRLGGLGQAWGGGCFGQAAERGLFGAGPAPATRAGEQLAGQGRVDGTGGGQPVGLEIDQQRIGRFTAEVVL